ncbi:hypothetical protein GGS24DRAFT_198536 [Hypoxylon argillaceum]|nr:hypothetical protein GGS24DRAFT_198536 [Hypoxylon argillaceum]
MVNAEGFFQHCRPEWTWPRLQTLALTSQLLQRENRSLIKPLLCRVGILVRNMPKLCTLVLWNGGKGHACAFIYRWSERNGASITWRGTWHLALSPDVINSWRPFGSDLPHSELSKLQVKQEQAQGVITSHGDAIHHLDLPCRVIEPASLWQIRREGYKAQWRNTYQRSLINTRSSWIGERSNMRPRERREVTAMMIKTVLLYHLLPGFYALLCENNLPRTLLPRLHSGMVVIEAKGRTYLGKALPRQPYRLRCAQLGMWDNPSSPATGVSIFHVTSSLSYSLISD